MPKVKTVNGVEYLKVDKIKFTIPINPTTKKNSSQIVKRGNRHILIPSKKYIAYENEVLWTMKDTFNEYEMIDEKVNVKAIYYRATKHTVDLVNLHSALHDTLVKAGLLKDDNIKIIGSTDGSRVYYDKDNPRTEVEITKFIK